MIGFAGVKVDITPADGGKKDSEMRVISKTGDVISFNESDDSEHDASDDDFDEMDLLRQVYMQQEQAIEQAMRTTTRAQNTFANEVKVMIKKIHNQQVIPEESKNYWESAENNQANALSTKK